MPKTSRITLRANAKLNLSLDITGRRGDGYHLMDMVLQSVSLYDELTVSLARERGIFIRSSSKYLPKDERNTSFKAARLLGEYAGVEPAVDISVLKRIPTQAGLGGGSADAAATLVALNELWGLNLSNEELSKIGEQVGADVPFCLVGGAARVTGIGEIIKPLPPLEDCWFTILMPPVGRSTKQLFSRFDEANEFERPDTDAVELAVQNGDAPETALLLKNVFDTFERDETTTQYKNLLLRHGALGASLTGSGAAVFGVFSDSISAKKCRNALFGKCRSAYAARGSAEGVVIISKT